MNRELCKACQQLFRREYPQNSQDGHQKHLHHATFSALQESSLTCQLCLFVFAELSSEMRRRPQAPAVEKLASEKEDVDNKAESHATSSTQTTEIPTGRGDEELARQLQEQFDREDALASQDPDGSEPVKKGVYCEVQAGKNGPHFLGFKCAEFAPKGENDWATIYVKPFKARKDLEKWRQEYKERQDRTASGSTNSPETFQLLKTWLNQCVNSHKCHMRQQYFPWTPTRLVEVEEVDGELRARLCPGRLAAGNIGDKPMYATLSHCWGISNPYRLIASNLHEFETRIPVEQLSRTFLDAMRICVGLGLRYIWIDSLCIIQDSKADWKNECAVMDQVYAQCYINLAATHSKDGSGGCFSTRDPRLVVQTAVWNKPPGKDAKRRWLRIQNPTEYWYNHVLRAPLNTRAWVLQERVLSPRKIHFGQHMVYWECAALVATEASPAGLDVHPRGTLLFKDLDSSPDDENRLWEFWGEVVDAYMETKITYPTDRIVAFSGIAKFMQNLFSEYYGHTVHYYAGIWSHWAEQQLTWETRSVDEEGAVEQLAHSLQNHATLEPERLPAPSWSWTAVNGRSTRIQKCAVEDQKFMLFRVSGDFLDGFEDDVEDQFLEFSQFEMPVQGWLWRRKPLTDDDKVFVGEFGYPDPGMDTVFTDSSKHYLLPMRWYPPDRDNSVYKLRCFVLVPADEGYFSRRPVVKEEGRAYFRRVGCMWYYLYVDRMVDEEQRRELTPIQELVAALDFVGDENILFSPLDEGDGVTVVARAANRVAKLVQTVYEVTLV